MSEKEKFVQVTLNIGSDINLSQTDIQTIIDQLQSNVNGLQAGPIDIIRKNDSPEGAPKSEPFITLGVAVLQFVVPRLIDVVYDMIKQNRANRVKVLAQVGGEQIRMDSQTDTNRFNEIKGKIQAAADVEQIPDRKFALLIATTQYQDNRLNQLASPELDIRTLADILKDPKIGGYDGVKLYLNESAATLQQAIEQFFTRKANTDLLLLYYSGHGIKSDEGKLYLAAENTDLETIRSTSLSSDFIIDEMDHSKSERQILILDCCYSGAFVQGAKNAVVGMPVHAESVFRGNGYGRVILTASDKTQVAWEGQRVMGQIQKSVFTEHLIEGLQTGEADRDRDGWIGLDELYKFVYNRMVRLANNQTPLLSVLGMKGSIYLARNPKPKPDVLPDELQRSLRSNFPAIREAAVNELCQLFQGQHYGTALAARRELEKLAYDDSQKISQIARQALGMEIEDSFWMVPEEKASPGNVTTNIPFEKSLPSPPPPARNEEPEPWWTTLKAPPGTRSARSSKSGPNQANLVAEPTGSVGKVTTFPIYDQLTGISPAPLAQPHTSEGLGPFRVTESSALLFGVLSLVLFFIPLFPVIGILIGIRSTRSNPQSSKAKAGLALSGIALGIQILLLVFIFLIGV